MNRPSVFARIKNLIKFMFSTRTQQIGVHGTSAQVEPLADGVEVFHRGWGTEVYGTAGQFVWLHFSIPLPLIIDDMSPALSSVFFRFKTENNASLRQIDLYDGITHFRTIQTNRNGDFTQVLVNDVNKIEEIRSIKKALGVSLGFRLAASFQPGSSSSILVTSAGAEYVY